MKIILLTAKHRLGRFCFYSKTGFGPTSTAIGAWAAPGQTRTTIYVFIILVTHPKFYIETTDHRDFGANRQMEVRTAAIVKNSGIL